MDKRLSIAVTGGIGSGKSLVMKLINEFGFTTFSCDKIYADLVYNKEYLSKIKEFFPFAIDLNGKLDRKSLSEIVFKDKTQLKKLNQIAHPLVFKILNEKISENTGLIFTEVPLLFESESENQFDFVIIIYRNIDDRISSVLQRDNLTKEQIFQRIENQFDYEKKLIKLKNNKKYFIVENNGDIRNLSNKINDIISKILNS
ncbi:MAG: dephospho-CoA kinase [Clostridiales bacterium]|nr:dephospho-CoA kinase [Clostridiales bacterium]